MNVRQTIRENWDVGFMVIAIGLILGWAVFITCLSPLMGQTVPRAIVTCDALEGAAAYNIKRGTTSTNMVIVGSAPTGTFLDESIEPTTKYYYAMSGIDSSAREGATGLAINNPFRFSDIQPASPANVTCTQSKQGNRVTLTCNWGIVTKTRSLILLPAGAVVTFRAFLSNTGTVQTFPTERNSMVISDVRRHQTFYFYVTAIWNGIESLGSPAVRIQT